MNVGQTIFSQLMEFVPRREFRTCVERYQGDYKVQSFSCWDHFLTLAFAQLTYRESLRDIEACLRAKSTKLYHMCIRSIISRYTMAHPIKYVTGESMPILLRYRSPWRANCM